MAKNRCFRYWHNFENCKVVASTCLTRTEFHEKYRAAFRASKQEGWFDKLVEMFWSYENWTLDMCQVEALKYTDMGDFYVHSRMAYKAADQNNWLDEICSHMPSSERYWTYDKLKEEIKIKKYKNKTEFAQANDPAYRSALHNGWLDELCKDMEILRRKKFTKEECIAAAQPYSRVVDLEKADQAIYNAARNNGWLDEVCAHMHHGIRKWTDEMLIEEAKKYKHKIDFLRGAPGAYTVASKKGILDKICSHMKDLGDLYNRAIYAWEFPDKTVYVGLTYNLEQREAQHLTNKNSPVFKYIQKTGLQPIYIVKYDYVFVSEAKRLEGEVLSEYVSLGWKKLNSIKTGGIGSVKEIWNAKSIEELAKTCDSRYEFMISYPQAYSACSKKKLMYVLDKVFPLMQRIDKNGRVVHPHYRKWSDEMIWNEVKKHSSLPELRTNNRKAYRAAEKWGLLQDIATYYTTLS